MSLLLKRVLDVAVSLVLLILLSPLLVLLAGLVLAVLGPPVLFRQWRPGLGGKPFLLAKFRTMKLGQFADGERMTRLGSFLRSASLDELPQLWNVLRGDMSLVGPRPLMMQYLPRYSPQQARRHEMRPGITGWAQVNGRNAIGWDERFRMDVWYIDHWSFGLDVKILLLTARRVLSRSGVRAPGEATMTEFLGNPARSESTDLPRGCH
ncbi:MAG TPA: sugar transferase [Planctomycetota bacterium]|jgi:lipopolysaccharide/colanic/teichoic acid biosynthesis glycosyltransferase|nr:sugar transferase [Planctomycetota bacterium]